MLIPRFNHYYCENRACQNYGQLVSKEDGGFWHPHLGLKKCFVCPQCKQPVVWHDKEIA